ncbi:anthranilate synthase component I family protein [Rothia kristinae]|uniref:anthranilate synthase component I family protein n=1 Tax=Rothia kristinae TaxID=37923 RepID=UPI00073682F4|nr:anthranilate synthase component I family protein [Rothia kristinae]MBG7586668.1 anthranilate synthase component I family protein [Rothia kristinae]MED6047148.1 anthranilate synthase component I family protein [Rothia kristinae]SQC37771.1 Para-aminobenzoate synthase component 1 [Rothia kristinae]
MSDAVRAHELPTGLSAQELAPIILLDRGPSSAGSPADVERVAWWLDTSATGSGWSALGAAASEDLRTGAGFAVPAPQEPPAPVPGLPEDAPALHGGAVGFLGYEAAADLEDFRADSRPPRAAPTPDSWWVRVRRHVLVDHRTGRAWAVGDPAWVRRIADAVRDAVDGAEPQAALPSALGRWADVVLPAPDRTGYETAVRAALAEIRDGNSYEVCLTAETSATLAGPLSLPTALGLYLAQRRANPAPHAAFLWGGDFAVLCSSPERFLRVAADGWCEAKPIKGTAARSADPQVDADCARALAADPKTRAENLMIADLMRNDLSRVCHPGSIRVPVLFGVETYASVHQLVSTVRGRLRPGRTAADLLAACLPPGSMTGAPKPRTLEIIDRLEGRARGIYSGTLGWIGADGTADLAVVIRTLVLTRGEDPEATTASIGAGGAIVADSDPAAEYEEMLAKLRAPLPPGWRIG